VLLAVLSGVLVAAAALTSVVSDGRRW